MDKGTKNISIKVDPELHKRLRLYVVEHETTVKDLFVKFVEELLREEAKKKSAEK